ncbi:MAG: IS110 family transposase, partial [Acidobacteria bacterium]|nr:IS110 family transposase [Acidobacteriota bacterium]
MRFYTRQHRHYCGIDLHARTMYLCILSHDGEILLERNLPCDPKLFLRTLEPYREDLVVAVECIFTWYWLADLCTRENIPFVLGHALYMKAIHGGKAKNDRIDAHKIAVLLRGGMLPQAYVYPPEMRSTRDLLRRRLYLVRKRGQLLAHIQNTHHQCNLPEPTRKILYKANREGIAEKFTDPSVRRSVEVDFELVAHYDQLIRSLELYLVRSAKQHDPNSFQRLRSLPGVGKILALTLLYEIHDIRRFPRVQDFASYARLVKCSKQSGGKKLGTGGRKIGNVHLKWAFSEAAVLFLRNNPKGQALLAKLRRKHGKGKALSILAHKLGRVTYHLLQREI